MKRQLVAIGTFFTGLGITLHAVARELYEKGGYIEIVRPQGEWIGLGLMVAAFVIEVMEVKRLWKKS